MELADVPVRDVRPLLTEERADFLALLASFGDADWVVPTEAGRWTVKDVALHLLDDDLGWLSRGRDNDRSGLLDDTGDYRQFVAALDAKNQLWVDGASGLSHRVLRDLLEWSGRQVDQYCAWLDLCAPSRVTWAGPGPVPVWFDLARDLTERWVHQQQIRDAVRAPGSHDRFLPDVLHTFRTGHRIMVQIQSSWFPLTDRNPQTFVDIPSAKASDFHKAVERVYRGGPEGTHIDVLVEE